LGNDQESQPKRVDQSKRQALRRAVAAFGLLALAVLASYHNSLDSPFIFDDEYAIVTNRDIRHFGTALRENPTIDTGTAVGRPLLRVSLWVNYALGGQEVRGYHILNLILHILATWTLWGVARRILESPRLRDQYGREAWGLALAIALLWTTHPLQTEAVTYVVQRAEILGGLFYLLTLYSVERSAASVRSRPEVWSVAAVAFCALGMASKETVATAPLLALAVDRAFFAPSWKRLWQSRRALYVALACTWIFQAMLVISSSGRKGTVGFALKIPWWQYTLTQPYYLCRYLALSLWPRALTLDYGTYLAQSVGEVAPYAAVVSFLLVLTIVAWWREPALGFCGLWFFLILAPTSSFVPVVTQTGAEHRMYLPLAGLIALGAVGGYTVLRSVWGEWPRRLRVASVLVVAVGATALGTRTIERNRDYASDLSIWGTVVDRWPINARGHEALGVALATRGRIPEAIAQFQEALRLQPDYANAHQNLGNTFMITRRLPEAIAQFEEALRLFPDYTQAHVNLGSALLSAGRLPEAIAQYETALRLQPDLAAAHLNLGNAFASTGRLPDAIAQFNEALRLQPDLARSGLPETIARLEEALRLPSQPSQSDPLDKAGGAAHGQGFLGASTGFGEVPQIARPR
jgi:tetratricopeptide (TPR) repeat protein